ncbi:hypothetical protein NX059_010705 [Plenodomus lindquistii]|nr:hypothetical protein NX059_010705 [Plenodomus lindquistii]
MSIYALGTGIGLRFDSWLPFSYFERPALSLMLSHLSVHTYSQSCIQALHAHPHWTTEAPSTKSFPSPQPSTPRTPPPLFEGHQYRSNDMQTLRFASQYK